MQSNDVADVSSKFVDNSNNFDRRWYGKLDSFTSGYRTNNKIEFLVLHHTAGHTAVSAFNTLKSRGLSVQYILDKDGTLYYVVDEGLTAWHAGCSTHSSCVQKYRNINSRSVGVEIVNTGTPNDPITEPQYASLRFLIKQMQLKYSNFRNDAEHIIGHYHITREKIDPSNLVWSKLSPNLASQTTLSEVRQFA